MSSKIAQHFSAGIILQDAFKVPAGTEEFYRRTSISFVPDGTLMICRTFCPALKCWAIVEEECLAVGKEFVSMLRTLFVRSRNPWELGRLTLRSAARTAQGTVPTWKEMAPGNLIYSIRTGR